MLPCMPTLQGNPLGPNENVFMRIMCDYVFMHFAPSFLPFLAVHVTRIPLPRINTRPVSALVKLPLFWARSPEIHTRTEIEPRNVTCVLGRPTMKMKPILCDETED